MRKFRHEMTVSMSFKGPFTFYDPLHFFFEIKFRLLKYSQHVKIKFVDICTHMCVYTSVFIDCQVFSVFRTGRNCKQDSARPE